MIFAAVLDEKGMLFGANRRRGCFLKKKFLFITHFYPPISKIASMRSWKLVQYIQDYGWEPIVLAAESDSEEWHCPLPAVSTHRVRSKVFLEGFVSFAKKILRKKALPSQPLCVPKVVEGDEKISFFRFVCRKILELVAECFAYPDVRRDWQRNALKCGREILAKEKVSLIVSTAGPYSSHIVASKLSKEFDVPWIADYRDLWNINHVFKHNLARRFFEKRLEKKILANAAAVVTVSKPWAQKQERFLGRPISVITNGFDGKDYSFPVQISPIFSVVYTGMIYKNKQDPSPLFQAIQLLLNEGYVLPHKIEVHFWGTNFKDFPQEKWSEELAQIIKIHPRIPVHQSMAEQKKATALLLLNWNNFSEKGVYPGKVFEYLGARRPILSLPANPDSVVDQLLEETRAGVTCTSPKEIAGVLKKWYDEFYDKGFLEYHGVEKEILKYDRKNQVKQFAELFDLSV